MTRAVRPFTGADAPAWVALSNLVLGHTVTPEDFRDQEARRDPAQLNRRWVVEVGGEVRGAAHLYVFPFDPPGFLHARVVVHPGARAQSFGRALWAVLEEAAQEAKAEGLVTDVDDADSLSLAWAERKGFHQHTHRFASDCRCARARAASCGVSSKVVRSSGVTFTDLVGADGATVERYLGFVADRLTETPDLAGHPRWPLSRVREILKLDHDPRPDWLLLAVSPQGDWLGTTAMIRIREFVYNELTATHPQARGRGLALPLKLLAIHRAREAGFSRMRTNNHSANSPMLRVNARLGFQARPGRYELHRPLR